MFGALPDHIIKDPKVTVTEKGVLLVLALHADKRDSCYPSQRTIAEMLGSCRKTVNRALNSLARKGLITITDRFRKGDAKGQTSSLYTLNFKRFDDMSHGGGDVSHGGGEKSYPLGRDVPRVVVSCPTGGGEMSHQEQIQEQTTNKTKEHLAAASPAPKKAKPTAAQKPPTPDEVQAYSAEWGDTKHLMVSPDLGQRFCDYYESKGWKVGESPMKSWQAAVRGWITRDKTPLRPGAVNPRPGQRVRNVPPANNFGR